MPAPESRSKLKPKFVFYDPVVLDWRFAHLCSSFDPLCKGLKDFSRMCIQSGVAENLFLPGGLAQISENIFEGNRRLAVVPGPLDS
jgi:hypothetical protein